MKQKPKKTNYLNYTTVYNISKKYIQDILSSDFPLGGRQKFNKSYEPNKTYNIYCPDCICCLERGGQDLNIEDYLDPSISYDLNNYSYRSDDFHKDNETKILFSGCSYTFGIGLPLKHVWASVVNDKLNNTSFNNLGISGASFQSIIQNVYSYIRAFNKPNAIMIMFPNLERYDQVIKPSEGKMFIEISAYADDYFEENKKIKETLTTEYVLRDFVNQVRALEDFCEIAGIKLYWGTWSIHLGEVLRAVGDFKSYLPIFESSDAYKLLDYATAVGDKTDKYWDSAREGHPGVKEQLMYAKAFLDEYEKNN